MGESEHRGSSLRKADKDVRIGLAFSGGGFRATLFHLGVVRCLRDAGLLKNVSVICSVSGGSILAAHLVQHWEKYNGNDGEFDDAARELIHFTQTDLRGNVIRPWLLSFLPFGIPRLVTWLSGSDCLTRTGLFERQYAHFFRGKQDNDVRLSDLRGEGRPELHLLSTSLTTGELVSVGTRGCLIEQNDSLVPFADDTQSLAFGVAASSAFPPLFAPVPATSKRLTGNAVDLPENGHFLTDGGVYDNLGLRHLETLNRREDLGLELLIYSSAERDVPHDYDSVFRFVWSRASRSTDVLMERISELEKGRANLLQQNDLLQRESSGSGHTGRPRQVIEIPLTQVVGQRTYGVLPESVQQEVQRIRTDLNVFTNEEIDGLVQHGQSVARRRLPAEYQIAAETRDVWNPCQHGDHWGLKGSSRLKLGLFSSRDWVSWVTAALLILYAYAPVAYLIDRETARAAARREVRQKEIVDKSERLVRGLMEIGLSRYQEEYEVGLRDWRHDVKQLRKHSFFAAVLNESELPMINVVKSLEDIGANMELSAEAYEEQLQQKGQGSTQRDQNENEKTENDRRQALLRKLHPTALQVAHVLRNAIIEKDKTEPGYQKQLKRLRDDLFEQDRIVAGRIVNWATRKTKGRYYIKPDAVRGSREEFWILYWGLLGLVEEEGEGSVEFAMVKFGEVVRKWENTRKRVEQPMADELHDRYGKLVRALENEARVDPKTLTSPDIRPRN